MRENAKPFTPGGDVHAAEQGKASQGGLVKALKISTCSRLVFSTHKSFLHKNKSTQMMVLCTASPQRRAQLFVTLRSEEMHFVIAF